MSCFELSPWRQFLFIPRLLPVKARLVQLTISGDEAPTDGSFTLLVT